MKPLAPAVAAAAAVVALTACSQNAATSSTTSTTSPAPSRTATATRSVSPADCRQQYNAWRDGPAGTVVTGLTAVDAAVTARDLPALTAAMKKAGPAAVRAARYPMPACADPQGYWMTLMMHVNAAGAITGGAAAMLSVLKAVPKVESELTAELKHTTG